MNRWTLIEGSLGLGSALLEAWSYYRLFTGSFDEQIASISRLLGELLWCFLTLGG